MLNVSLNHMKLFNEPVEKGSSEYLREPEGKIELLYILGTALILFLLSWSIAY